MQTKTSFKLLSILLVFLLTLSLCPSTVRSINLEGNATPGHASPVDNKAVSIDGVFWSSTIGNSYISRNLVVDDMVSLSSLGLNPYVVRTGVTSSSFTWTSSSPSVATINSSTGLITAVSEGTTLIIGTSTVYGSSIGQLMMLLFVADENAEYTMVGINEIIDNIEIDRTVSFQGVGQYINDMGYYDARTYGVIPWDDPTMTAALFASYMANTNILYFRGHGTQSRIALNAAQNVNFRYSYVDELPTNSFSNCKLVLYAACSTAMGGANGTNLVNSTKNRGAGTVVGFSTTVMSNEVDAWSIQFFYVLSMGYTVNAACDYAYNIISQNPPSSYFNSSGALGTGTWRVAGNGSTTF